MKQFEAKISVNEKVAPDHYALSFKTPRGTKTKPGQFFNIRVSESYEPLLRRPFGAQKIGKDNVEILYKVVGKATEILSIKKKGEMLDIVGPLGNGFSMATYVRHCEAPQAPKQSQTKGLLRALPRPRNDGVQVILVAGGHGIAPLYAFAQKLITYNLELITLIGAKTKKHVVCEEDFRRLGVRVHVATEDGTKGHKGMVTDLLRSKLRCTMYDVRCTSIYACGPKPMLKETAKFAKRHKIPCQLSLEEYMACGIGTCLGCAVKTRNGYKMVCKDGPVFEAKEIVWERETKDEGRWTMDERN